MMIASCPGQCACWKRKPSPPPRTAKSGNRANRPLFSVIPAPQWFVDALAKNLGADELWGVVMYEAFADFPAAHHAQAWSPETACMGNFNKAFDEQPGIVESRNRWLEMQTPETQEKLLASLTEQARAALKTKG